ncbi:hypothetical protein [Parafrankia discariae]|uniref:hypothetical protein n=1 Tax=Parafrankia discariae TaxID=365528 RepID=UPI00036B89DC|nr:hypothetical protein [Parafrankia discariae]
MKLRWRKSKLTTSPTYGGAVDLDEDLDELDDELTEAGPGAGAQPAGPAQSGPVLLTLTTRDEIEKAAERAANPQPVRRRMERGMFGGAPAGHEHGGGACGTGGCR